MPTASLKGCSCTLHTLTSLLASLPSAPALSALVLGALVLGALVQGAPDLSR